MSYENNDESVDTRESEAMRKMFVGGLNRDTTEEEFFDYFGHYGNMVDKVIIKDPQTKISRGFGFITYDQSDSVENVFQARPHTIGNKTLDVKRAMPREYNTAGAHSKVTKLFIGGIGPDLTPEELQEYIESRHPTTIGTVDKIDFLKERDTNKNKGFGFLECSDADFADRLTISESSFVLKGKTMSLKKAEPKNSEGGGGGGRGGARGSRGGGRGGAGRGRGSYGGSRGGAGGYGVGRGGGGGYNSYDNNQGGGYGQQQNQGYGNGYNNSYNSYPAQNQNYGYQQPQTGYGQSGYEQYSQQQQPPQGYSQQPNQGSRGAWGGGNNRYQPY